MGGQKWPSFFPESCSMCDNVLRSAVAQVFAKPFIPEACKDDNIPLSLYMHYISYNLFFVEREEFSWNDEQPFQSIEW